jgi:hypothetical protein
MDHERYEDIGKWFSREESAVCNNSPHIFSQGSFRLGTAIRPINDGETYDLDLSCKLATGITTQSHTQKMLKTIVAAELEAYRKFRGIKNPLEEKHRCWRLGYQDDLEFHMDIVPCIPASKERQKKVLEAIQRFGSYIDLANEASLLTVSITDNRHPGYDQIISGWNISNPEGYARWFELRMKLSQVLKESRLAAAQIDKVPMYKMKTPLQRCIQLLKRHRDQMFLGNEGMKPISIIITTLASEAYRGESDIASALEGILDRMGDYVRSSRPRVPNPVDPEEDFADRWYSDEGLALQLEGNFWRWLQQAQSDFNIIFSQNSGRFITEQAQLKLAVNVDKNKLEKQAGIQISPMPIIPKKHNVVEPAKPWRSIWLNER